VVGTTDAGVVTDVGVADVGVADVGIAPAPDPVVPGPEDGREPEPLQAVAHSASSTTMATRRCTIDER